MSIYTVNCPPAAPSLHGDNEESWQAAEVLEVGTFHERSSYHRPTTQVRLLHTQRDLYLWFQVSDQYVRSIHTSYQDGVCRDSCVEFFVQPKADKGYFNFEINAGGTLLLYYICNPERQPGKGFREWTKVAWEHARTLDIHHSLPKVVEPELKEPTEWWIKYRIPVALFEAYVGELGELSGQQWRANFYKCADDTSHPHWASWQPVGDPLDFHKPQCFGPLRFA